MTSQGERRPSPRAPAARSAALWALGLGGLIPFAALTVLLLVPAVAIVPRPTVILALSGYAAAILSFLGGIRWGAWLLTPRLGPIALAVSVLPSLAAWLILLLLPPPASFACLAAAFLAQGAWDVTASRRGLLPPDFGRLRIVLTAVVVLCMTAAAIATRG